MVNELLVKPQSVARLIAYSGNFKDLYSHLRQKSQEQVRISQRIQDLAWAPQRYASEAKVLVRMVLTWPAILALLQAVPSIRGMSSSEGQACLQTLQWLSTERVVQLSLMADAALELANLVRELDRSDLNEADVFEELERHKSVQRKLFLEGLVFQMPACAHVMAQYLTKPTAIMCGGISKTIGGGEFTEAVRKLCLTRMSAFCVLSEKLMEAEFPAFELLACLRVFSLQDEIRSTRQAKTGERNRCLEQLAKAIRVDPDLLKWEFNHFLPIAQNFYNAGDLTNFAAWKKAIEATSKSRTSHTVDALRPAVVRLGAWSSSSCEVERGFAKAQASKPQGSSQDDDIEIEENFLLIQDARERASKEAEWKEIFRTASKIWSEQCGRVRVSGSKRKQRWDKGLCRHKVSKRHHAIISFVFLVILNISVFLIMSIMTGKSKRLGRLVS